MKLIIAAACAVASLLSIPATADTRPDSHAPIGVMGDHTHQQGEIMLSYRFMHMDMEGNLNGTSNQSPEEIVTTEPNRFSNPPMQPPMLRVVPTKMTMDMHMFGAMYAPSDRITLMTMFNYIEKEMEHVTFMGPMGTTRLGGFTTETSGFGDTSLAALVKVFKGGTSRWHVTAGISLPTGDIEETDTILTPMNTRPSPRLPYPMQLGSGTYDVIAGLTYAQHSAAWGWGSQWRSVFRTGENDENYTLGDEHRLTGWLSYSMNPYISFSGRLEYFDRGNIDGIDPLIVAPVQTADPDRQGAKRVDASLGFNFLLPGEEQRLALEINVPIRQDLDGPQLETDWHATVGWQFAF
ncbi:MAG: hypothetical protein ACR2P1_17965 [Pseudomonadales bacterium]